MHRFIVTLSRGPLDRISFRDKGFGLGSRSDLSERAPEHSDDESEEMARMQGRLAREGHTETRSIVSNASRDSRDVHEDSLYGYTPEARSTTSRVSVPQSRDRGLSRRSLALAVTFQVSRY